MEVVIDSREQQRGVDAKYYYIDKHEDNARIEELLVGDYIFCEDPIVIDFSENYNEACVFEVKKYCTDCIPSIIDYKLHNQALEQFKVFKWHFVMIIGTQEELDEALAYHIDRFNRNRYDHAIGELNTFTTVLYAEDEEEAFRKMRIQSLKCFEMKPLMKKTLRKTACPAYNFLVNDVKGVSEVLAGKIVERGALHTLDDLLDLTAGWLCEIDKIGPNRAELIMSSIRKERGIA